MYEKLTLAAEYIRKKKDNAPKIGLVLGSGLGSLVDCIEDKFEIPYGEIPFFRETTVEGHDGRLILGKIDGVETVVLQGRYHVYEGIPMEEVVFPTRVLATLGIEVLMLTNAAGGINTTYTPGELVLIKDHINMMGKNPLIGPNINELGPRFPDMTQAYDLRLQDIIRRSAAECGYNIHSGVYIALQGPTYETPAEVRMLRIMGADMVGMSTVPESIAANHLGLRVCGISCITNMAAGIKDEKLSHDDVKAQAIKVMSTFTNILRKSIKSIGKEI